MEKLVIVGAGMCGLTLASLRSAASKPALLFEKSKGVGGRLATRRDGDASFDHGAAFYVDSDQESLVWHQRWLGNKKSVPWFEDDQRKYFFVALQA